MHPTTSSEPVALTLELDTFSLGGKSNRYQKRFADLAGLYRDSAAFEAQSQIRGAEDLAYWVDESRVDDNDPGSLIIGLSVVLPGQVGAEFAMTRGHLHEIADRAEFYQCVSGRGVMLMETVEGRSRAVELTPGTGVHVPGHWIHRSVNVGNEPFVTLFCYPADASQDYDIIRRANGMSELVVNDGAGGWRTSANLEHIAYEAR